MSAFDHLEPHQQPDPISISNVNAIASAAKDMFGHLADRWETPNMAKRMVIQGKETTKDLDIVVEFNTQKWADKIISNPNIVTHIKNGGQLMVVVQNLIGDGRQYFLDFLSTGGAAFDSKVFYTEYGTHMPAMLGVFARSLDYKLTQSGLQLRMKDHLGQFHNVHLTNSVDEMLKILMLDPSFIGTSEAYVADGVANWIMESPLFSSHRWHRQPTEDNPVAVVNRNAKRAKNQKPEIRDAFHKLGESDITPRLTNNDYVIEYAVIGTKRIQAAIRKGRAKINKAKKLISGDDLISHGLKPGPHFGKILSEVQYVFEVEKLTPAQLNDSDRKLVAIGFALEMAKEIELNSNT